MSDDTDTETDKRSSSIQDRPVLVGFIALFAVAAVIGIIGGVTALVGSRMLGLDGGSATSTRDEPTSGSSLYLPEPTITSDAPVPETDAPTTTEPSSSSAAVTEISLSASQQSVSAMQQIDLTGTYPSGEGAILQVQRFEDGAWSDFPVTMSVSNQTFSTYVQTSRPGPNKFRVIDSDTDRVSNEVVVKVG